jgi:hypothetical protein
VAVEIVKRDGAEFGGMQFRNLGEEACSLRMCCARNCARRGWAQITVAYVPPCFRVICKEHALLGQILMLSALGDTVPSVDIKSAAESIGVDLNNILKAEPEVVSLPDKWRCFNCGNGLLFEHFGADDEHGAWIHKCGIDGYGADGLRGA